MNSTIGNRITSDHLASGYRPTSIFALCVAALAVSAITWAFLLLGDSNVIGNEPLVSHVGEAANPATLPVPDTPDRTVTYLLIGAVAAIALISIGTVLYLNSNLIKARTLIRRRDTNQRETNMLKERFLTSVTHELNTPITVATALTDVLVKNKQGNLTDRQLKQLAAVQRSTQHLSDIVDVMIQTSTTGIQQGLRLEEIDYSAFVTAALDRIGQDIELRGVQIELDTEQVDELVSIDTDRITQVLTNLLANAAQSSAEGSKVQVSLNREGNMLKTSVRDSGSGIALHDRAHVFSPFFRADTERIRRVRGLGLGLTMVQRIVEVHDGQVGFDSNKDGSGVTFWYTLPIAG